MPTLLICLLKLCNEKDFFTLTVLSSVAISAQSKNEKTILQILDRQTADRNRGNIDAFMKGYREHDSLMFVGKSGVIYGYNHIWENYKKTLSGQGCNGEASIYHYKGEASFGQVLFCGG